MHSGSHPPSLAAHSSTLTALDHIARLQEITAAAAAAPQAQSVSNPTNLNSSYTLQNDSRADSRSATNAPVMMARTNEIDPTTILEWPPALRYVSKLGSRGDDLMIGIKQVRYSQRVLTLV
jgi:hypothetical protein